MLTLSHSLQGSDHESWSYENWSSDHSNSPLRTPTMLSDEGEFLFPKKQSSTISLLKNPYAMSAISVLIAIPFIAISYYFYKQHPYYESLSHKAGQEAFNEMVNRTFLEGPPEWGLIYSPPANESLPLFFHDCLKSIFGCQYTAYHKYNDPPQAHYDCDDNWSQYNPVFGTINDWINVVVSRCGCSFDFWKQYADLLINKTDPNPYNMVCNLNPDKRSICCGNVWGKDSYNKFGFPLIAVGDNNIRVIRGDALEAQNITRENYFLLHWTAVFATLCGTGAFATALPLFLMGIACCYY